MSTIIFCGPRRISTSTRAHKMAELGTGPAIRNNSVSIIIDYVAMSHLEGPHSRKARALS